LVVTDSTQGSESERKLDPALAFAFMLESACEDFETLQNIIRGSIQLVAQGGAPFFAQRHPYLRARGVINMALAKSFLFHVRRANRICTQNKAAIALDRLDRLRFLKATGPFTHVRNENEHGFDENWTGGLSLHRHQYHGGPFDVRSLIITGPEQVLMGSLNLHDPYLAVSRVRKIAGFPALAEKDRNAKLQLLRGGGG
jgi:hypothetical protein